jgi:hypothetical protein
LCFLLWRRLENRTTQFSKDVSYVTIFDACIKRVGSPIWRVTVHDDFDDTKHVRCGAHTITMTALSYLVRATRQRHLSKRTCPSWLTSQQLSYPLISVAATRCASSKSKGPASETEDSLDQQRQQRVRNIAWNENFKSLQEYVESSVRRILKH